MRIEIEFYKLHTILQSKTLTKILSYILIQCDEQEERGLPGEVYITNLNTLRKSLGYKNKSTVSRGLATLQALHILKVFTNSKGVTIMFPCCSVARV